MKMVKIRLSSARDVQRFVGVLVPLRGDFDLISGEYVLDARSLMGIFGLDLSKPLCLKMHDDRPENLAAIQPFRVAMEEDDHGQ